MTEAGGARGGRARCLDKGRVSRHFHSFPVCLLTRNVPTAAVQPNDFQSSYFHPRECGAAKQIYAKCSPENVSRLQECVNSVDPWSPGCQQQQQQQHPGCEWCPCLVHPIEREPEPECRRSGAAAAASSQVCMDHADGDRSRGQARRPQLQVVAGGPHCLHGFFQSAILGLMYLL